MDIAGLEIVFLVQVDERYDDDDSKADYSIKLLFDKNPFFENDVLVKEIFIGSVKLMSTCTDIKWKKGMNLVEQKQVNKSI